MSTGSILPPHVKHIKGEKRLSVILHKNSTEYNLKIYVTLATLAAAFLLWISHRLDLFDIYVSYLFGI